jgi:hypothetical protein
VLLDLVENADSGSSADDDSGGGAGCFITSGSEGNSADLKLWLTIILSAIILLGSTGRGKRSQKK